MDNDSRELEVAIRQINLLVAFNPRWKVLSAGLGQLWTMGQVVLTPLMWLTVDLVMVS